MIEAGKIEIKLSNVNLVLFQNFFAGFQFVILIFRDHVTPMTIDDIYCKIIFIRKIQNAQP